MSEKKFTEKTPKHQFLSFPIISSSNEPRGRASHWGMNTSGIGQCQIFSNFFEVSEMKFTENTRKNNFWVLPIYLFQMKPGDVLVIGEWTFLELGNVRFFWNFSKCPKWNYREKPEKINFWVFQLHLVQMSPGDVLVIEERTLLELDNVRFFQK